MSDCVLKIKYLLLINCRGWSDNARSVQGGRHHVTDGRGGESDNGSADCNTWIAC